MALIPLSAWIDRFGTLDEAGEPLALSTDALRTGFAWESSAAVRIAVARDGLGAFLKEAWARQGVARLTLRRS